MVRHRPSGHMELTVTEKIESVTKNYILCKTPQGVREEEGGSYIWWSKRGNLWSNLRIYAGRIWLSSTLSHQIFFAGRQNILSDLTLNVWFQKWLSKGLIRHNTSVKIILSEKVAPVDKKNMCIVQANRHNLFPKNSIHCHLSTDSENLNNVLMLGFHFYWHRHSRLVLKIWIFDRRPPVADLVSSGFTRQCWSLALMGRKFEIDDTWFWLLSVSN